MPVWSSFHPAGLGFTAPLPPCSYRLEFLLSDITAPPSLQVSFEQDIILSQMNEYEVLQLLMGDCRERLALYSSSLEEDIKIGQVCM